MPYGAIPTYLEAQKDFSIINRSDWTNTVRKFLNKSIDEAAKYLEKSVSSYNIRIYKVTDWNSWKLSFDDSFPA